MDLLSLDGFDEDSIRRYADKPIHVSNRQIIFHGMHQTYFYDYKKLTFLPVIYNYWYDGNIYSEFYGYLWKIENGIPTKKIMLYSSSKIHISNDKIYMNDDSLDKVEDDGFNQIYIYDLNFTLLDIIKFKNQEFLYDIHYMYGKVYLWTEDTLFSIDLKTKNKEYVYKNENSIYSIQYKHNSFNGVLVILTYKNNNHILYIISKTINKTVNFPLGFYNQFRYNNNIIILYHPEEDDDIPLYMVYNYKIQLLYVINTTKFITYISNKYIVYGDLKSDKFSYWIKNNILKLTQNTNYKHILRLMVLF